MESKKNPDEGAQRSLGSAEYRAKLQSKLNCLIAVLEVAIAKITRNLDLPGANEQRLLKIRANLENTLAICNRAKLTLEKAIPEGRPALPAPQVNSQDGRARLDAHRRMTYRDYVELISIDEYRKFKSLTPISPKDVVATNLDDLVRKLMAN
jgi:hypothetical protein